MDCKRMLVKKSDYFFKWRQTLSPCGVLGQQWLLNPPSSVTPCAVPSKDVHFIKVRCFAPFPSHGCRRAYLRSMKVQQLGLMKSPQTTQYYWVWFGLLDCCSQALCCAVWGWVVWRRRCYAGPLDRQLGSLGPAPRWMTAWLDLFAGLRECKQDHVAHMELLSASPPQKWGRILWQTQACRDLTPCACLLLIRIENSPVWDIFYPINSWEKYIFDS